MGESPFFALQRYSACRCAAGRVPFVSAKGTKTSALRRSRSFGLPCASRVCRARSATRRSRLRLWLASPRARTRLAMNTRHTAAMLGGFKSRGEEKLKASQTHCHKQYFLIATRTIRADRKDEILLAGICQGNLVPNPLIGRRSAQPATVIGVSVSEPFNEGRTCLSECNERVVRPPGTASTAGHRRSRRSIGVCFLWVTFLCTSKER